MLNRHVDDIVMENGTVVAVKSQGEVRSRTAAIIGYTIYHDVYPRYLFTRCRHRGLEGLLHLCSGGNSLSRSGGSGITT